MGREYIVFAVLARDPLRRGVPTGSSDLLTGESISGNESPIAEGAMLKTVSKSADSRMHKE